jgi:predicted metal-dependent hydrolase
MPDAPSEIVALPYGPTRVCFRRHRRARRVSLRVDPAEGVVIVTLPTRASRQSGLALLRSHADWIAGRLAALPRAVPFVDGAVIPIAGEPHTIRHTPAARRGAWLDATTLHVSGAPEFLARRVTDFLRAEARRRIGALALVKASAIEARVARITIKDTTSRWGSCAPDGALAFSWRLVLAPPFVQDYVAAHEVAHLRHMNHGPRFWDLVSHLTMHRTPATAWLRREGPALLRVGQPETPGRADGP